MMTDLQEIREAVLIRPGDTLVVRCDRTISPETAARIKAMILERIPGIDVLVVAADQLLVYRPGEMA